MIRCLLAAVFSLGFGLVPAISAQVPRPSPEYAIQLTTGEQLLLSQYRGKVVVLEFLLTDCPHCQRTSETVERLYKVYGPRGFQALGVAINEMASMLVTDFIKRFRLTFPVGFSARDQAGGYLQHSPMFRMLMPQMVFIDRTGVIRAQYAGDDKFFTDEEKNTRAMIETLLKEPAAKMAPPSTPKPSARKKAS